MVFATHDGLGKFKRAFVMFALTNRNLQQLIVVFTLARNLWSVESVLTPARTRPTWRSTAKVKAVHDSRRPLY